MQKAYRSGIQSEDTKLTIEKESPGQADRSCSEKSLTAWNPGNTDSGENRHFRLITALTREEEACPNCALSGVPQD